MEKNSKTNETLVNLIRSGTDRAENLLQLWKQNKAFIATLARKYSGGAYQKLERGAARNGWRYLSR